MRRCRSWDGAELAFRVVGSGPPLVCIPGSPGRAAEYPGNQEDLALLPRAGHFTWVDDPASFANIVDEFLARRPAPPVA